jgi:hypothetical protein
VPADVLLTVMQVDTISKRLMSNRANVRKRTNDSILFASPKLSLATLNTVVFRKYAEASIGGKFLSLFPGLGYAAGYKILQRIYK